MHFRFREATAMPNFIYGSHPFKEVQILAYLGVMINRKNERQDKLEISKRK